MRLMKVQHVQPSLQAKAAMQHTSLHVGHVLVGHVAASLDPDYGIIAVDALTGIIR